jgi:hypothetical protein
MTDTDTPRTTAPATMSDALTAEQIELATIMAEMDEIEAYHPNVTLEAVRRRVRIEWADHATLRDRLARAEERERVLREALVAMGSCLSVDETRLGMLMINGTKTASEVPEQAARVEKIKEAWAMRRAILVGAEEESRGGSN